MVVQENQNSIFLTTAPSAPLRRLRDICLLAQPSRLIQGGELVLASKFLTRFTTRLQFSRCTRSRAIIPDQKEPHNNELRGGHMRRASAISILALFLSSTQVLPQQPPAGAIEGTIVRADSGEPIAGAQVTLTAMNAPLLGDPAVTGTNVPGVVVGGIVGGTFSAAPAAVPPQAPPRPGVIQPVTTAADGKFSFKNLAAGTYRVAATANGFVPMQYGQRTPNSQGRPVYLIAGQTLQAAMRMIPTGTVSGRVFDENGQPATGAPVQLLRPIYNIQGRNLQAVSASAVDDRGEYRLYGVPPGRYYLVAGNPPGPNRVIAPGLGPIGGLNTQRYSLAFYPTGSTVEQASTVEVNSGGEASFDLRVQRQSQTFRIRGHVVNTTGIALPVNTNIMMGYRAFSGGGSFSNGRNFDPATGIFEVQNIPPGEYTLQVQIPETNPLLGAGGPIDASMLAARQAAQAARPSAQLPIRVIDKDIENVVLTLSPGVTAEGRFIVEGQPVTAIPNLQQMSLAFSSASGPTPGSVPAGTLAGPDGSFQVVGLREGEYRVMLRGALPPASGLYVNSIRYGGDDVFSKPLKFSGSGSGTFEVVLRSGPGQLAGNVSDARSQPVPGVQVIAIPVERGRTNDYRMVITDQNGRYSMPGLRPGDYELFSWETIDNGAQYDPDFLRRYEQQARKVHVAESSNQTVDVRLIPVP